MAELLGIAPSMLFGQLLIGLINGACYALLSLGLAIIFGLLNIINFTHGAQYMMGAFAAWFLLTKLGVGYWWSLVLAPIAVGAFGVIIERTMLSKLYKLDHLYGLLLTFGLALIIQGVFRNEFGSSGLPYQIPPELAGGTMMRAWLECPGGNCDKKPCKGWAGDARRCIQTETASPCLLRQLGSPFKEACTAFLDRAKDLNAYQLWAVMGGFD